jgi:hypothetical protein
MILAEIDPIQIAIIVIAMLGGFVQWIWSLIKQSQEEAARAKAPPSTEEQKLREAAWKKQVQAPNSPPPPPLPQPLAPQAPTTPNDPWAAAKEIFDQIKKEAAGQTQLPPMTPQRPASAKKAPAYVPPALPTPQVVTVAPVILPSAPITHATPAAKAASDRQDGLELLKGMLASPASIRQAVLMREILGPPKALQTSADSPF